MATSSPDSIGLSLAGFTTSSKRLYTSSVYYTSYPIVLLELQHPLAHARFEKTLRLSATATPTTDGFIADYRGFAHRIS